MKNPFCSVLFLITALVLGCSSTGNVIQLPRQPTTPKGVVNFPNLSSLGDQIPIDISTPNVTFRIANVGNVPIKLGELLTLANGESMEFTRLSEIHDLIDTLERKHCTGIGSADLSNQQFEARVRSCDFQ